MPISQELLDILCCPSSKKSVALLPPERLATLNAAIEAGDVRYADGTPVENPLEEGLLTSDDATVYRIDDSIPVMLVDKAIATEQVEAW